MYVPVVWINRRKPGCVWLCVLGCVNLWGTERTHALVSACARASACISSSQLVNPPLPMTECGPFKCAPATMRSSRPRIFISSTQRVRNHVVFSLLRLVCSPVVTSCFFVGAGHSSPPPGPPPPRSLLLPVPLLADNALVRSLSGSNLDGDGCLLGLWWTDHQRCLRLPGSRLLLSQRMLHLLLLS